MDPALQGPLIAKATRHETSSTVDSRSSAGSRKVSPRVASASVRASESSSPHLTPPVSMADDPDLEPAPFKARLDDYFSLDQTGYSIARRQRTGTPSSTSHRGAAASQASEAPSSEPREAQTPGIREPLPSVSPADRIPAGQTSTSNARKRRRRRVFIDDEHEAQHNPRWPGDVSDDEVDQDSTPSESEAQPLLADTETPSLSRATSVLRARARTLSAASSVLIWLDSRRGSLLSDAAMPCATRAHVLGLLGPGSNGGGWETPALITLRRASRTWGPQESVV